MMDQPKRYKCVLFDMDGTLVDSYEGIFHAYQRAMKQMGQEFLKNYPEVMSVIVGSVETNMPEEQVATLVKM